MTTNQSTPTKHIIQIYIHKIKKGGKKRTKRTKT